MSSIRMNQETVFGVATRTTIPFTKQETRPNKKLKKSKKGIFPKGLVYGFGQKLVIFPDFYFRENRPEKCVLRYSRTKKRLSRL